MNLTDKSRYPALIAASGGILGLILRVMLYRTGFDDRGILSSSHPLHLACLALAAGMLVCLALAAAGSEEAPGDQPLLRFFLGLSAGFFLLVHCLALYRQSFSSLRVIRCLLTAAAGIAMTVCLFPAKQSRNVSPVCHGTVCACFAGDMLCRYRHWSGNPQLPDYVFHVLAGVALSLCAYQTLALYTGLGKPRLRRFFCLSALFLCILCLAGPEPRAFYLSGALWAAACLLIPVPPEPEAVEEEEADVPA